MLPPSARTNRVARLRGRMQLARRFPETSAAESFCIRARAILVHHRRARARKIVWSGIQIAPGARHRDIFAAPLGNTPSPAGELKAPDGYRAARRQALFPI